MTLGTMGMEDGIVHGMDICTLTTADGTEHGIHIGTITTIITLSTEDTSRMTAGMAADTPQAQTGYSQAEYPPEVESEHHQEYPEARPVHLYPEQQRAAQAQVEV